MIMQYGDKLNISTFNHAPGKLRLKNSKFPSQFLLFFATLVIATFRIMYVLPCLVFRKVGKWEIVFYDSV